MEAIGNEVKNYHELLAFRLRPLNVDDLSGARGLTGPALCLAVPKRRVKAFVSGLVVECLGLGGPMAHGLHHSALPKTLREMERQAVHTHRG